MTDTELVGYQSFRDEEDEDEENEEEKKIDEETWNITASGSSVDDNNNNKNTTTTTNRSTLSKVARLIGVGLLLLLRLVFLGAILILLIMLLMVAMNSFSRSSYFFITLLSLLIVEVLFALICVAPCRLLSNKRSAVLMDKRKAKLACGILACDFVSTFILSQVVIAVLLPNICLFSNSLGEAIGSVSIFNENVELLPATCRYNESFAKAREFYRCANLDFTDVRVNIGGMVDWIGDAPAMCAGDLIMIRRNQTYWGVDYKCVDTSTLVHEIAHVWQHQNAPLNVASYIELMQQQIVNRSGDINVYSYGNLTSQFALGKQFTQFNVEQQASIVQDFFRTKPRNTSALYKFASRVVFEKCNFDDW